MVTCIKEARGCTGQGGKIIQNGWELVEQCRGGSPCMEKWVGEERVEQKKFDIYMDRDLGAQQRKVE